MNVVLAMLAAMSFADVASLTREEAAQSSHVCVTGVVTQVVDWRGGSGVLADPSSPNGRGLYFQCAGGVPPEGWDGFRIGDVVEVSGVTTPLSFAPGIWASACRKVGQMVLPPVPRRRLGELRHGRLDNARVRLGGVLVDAREVESKRMDANAAIVQLSLVTDEGGFVAHVPGSVDEWRWLVDAELDVAGCAMSAFNLRAEFRGVQLEVASREDIKVDKWPPATPFDVKRVPVSGLMSFSPHPHDVHAKRVGGVVTLVSERDGFFYLQEGAHGLKVTMRDISGLGLEIGDEVEVVGFPIYADGCGELRGKNVRRVGKGALPEPFCADLSDYGRWQYYTGDGSLNDYVWRRVAFTARVVRAESVDGMPELYVAASNISCRVRLAGSLPQWLEDADRMRPLARITAIAEPKMSDTFWDDRLPTLTSLSFAVASPEDIEFVPDVQWRERVVERNLRYVMWGIGAVMAMLIAVGAVFLLRAGRERGRTAAISAERKRMAADLHDTIEQNLAGAKMLMESSLTLAPDVPGPVADAVNAAAAILAHARSEIRSTIFNLRSDEIFDRRPEDVFRETVRQLNRGMVDARCRLRGLPGRLQPSLFSDILCIVQEAVTNAVKHGRAKQIVLASDPLPSGGFAIRVLNDGEPFDASAALGPESGHFGLAGMRERTKRNGMSIAWGRDGKWTEVKLEVPKS